MPAAVPEPEQLFHDWRMYVVFIPEAEIVLTIFQTLAAGFAVTIVVYHAH